jgi:hypothetical protein
VDRARRHLLARARLAAQQHGRVVRRDLADHLAHAIHRGRIADQAIARERQEIAVERGDDLLDLRVTQRKFDREAIATRVDQMRERGRIGGNDDRHRQPVDFEPVERGVECGAGHRVPDERGAPAARLALARRVDALREHGETECAERRRKEANARHVDVEHADGRRDVADVASGRVLRFCIDDDANGIQTHENP